MTTPTPTTGLTPDVHPPSPAATPRGPRRLGDRVFSSLATSSASLILVLLAGVAIFLVAKSLPVWTDDTTVIPGGGSFLSYVGPLVFGTLLVAVLALLIATPLALAIALFISHYASRRVARTLGYVIDLLAAIPSVVFGIWGVTVLAPHMKPVLVWLDDNLGFLPFFAGPASATGRTALTVALVLAVMILPIMTAINREVFLQTPTLHQEAALALGATRWEMIRMTVIPYGRSGLVSGAMLGLGRALGETLAVLLVLSGSGAVNFNLISRDNPSTIAATIAKQFPEAPANALPALIATGLVLFVITFAVNFLARALLNRRKDFDGAAG
ncbi:MAG: phosphate transporter, inner rane subunit PstC [Frankiales bacterium]|nr:phosphate transporter, inner rane subunit PstC [Frankiales bacterium]